MLEWVILALVLGWFIDHIFLCAIHHRERAEFTEERHRLIAMAITRSPQEYVAVVEAEKTPQGDSRQKADPPLEQIGI